MKVINVVGARPNFMKMAPIVQAMNACPQDFNPILVHTGQHYDERMSQSFFEELAMPRPDLDLGVGSGSHAQQTARVMEAFEKVCLAEQPDLVIVVGDVNSTFACAITAKKLGIRVGHVEAGLRSRDMEMPEELNRLCTDALCDYLFTTDLGAGANLQAEGVSEDRIFFVGNVMIDTLLAHLRMAQRLTLGKELGLQGQHYATLTLHRPSNVDDPEVLRGILEALQDISNTLPIVFPMHPRTRKRIEEYGYSHFLETGDSVHGIWVTQPMGYLEFLHLNMNAHMVFTDSGGLQEETTVLGVPCLTLRHNTERPITCEQGTNRIVGNQRDAIVRTAAPILAGDMPPPCRPDKWDGHAAERIIQVLQEADFGVA